LAKQCEVEYGDFDKALGVIFSEGLADEQGRCLGIAYEKAGGLWRCPAHMDIYYDEGGDEE
jgi:hypothetical protein